MYIPTDADLVLEDTIETSGLGGIYPKGIQIGKIKEIDLPKEEPKEETQISFEDFTNSFKI